MIKDKTVRDRFCMLELDDSKKIEDFLISAEKKIKSLENTIIDAQNIRNKLDISKDFTYIEDLDRKINNLSIKKVFLNKEILQLREEKN